MQVPLLDLAAHHAPLKDEFLASLARVAESQHFILGPEVERLEAQLRDYLGCRYAWGVSSGTDALLMALMAIDLAPGDEVIVPTYSFFATAGVVARLNAKPVFVDIDPVTFNIDPTKVAAKITPRSRAIIPVHLFGQAAEMAEIMALAREYNLVVIEDAAQAIGVQTRDGQKVGNIGHIGCFSFFPSKNLGAFGDAGLVTTNDPALGEKLKLLRTHGAQPKYYHKLVGGNFRIDAIQASVLNVKLPHLARWSQKRRDNAALYTELFSAAALGDRVILPTAAHEKPGVKNFHIYNQYVVRTDKRDALKKFLADKGVGTEIYYPVPFHRQECFAGLGGRDADFPAANRAAETSLALPIYPELSRAQITYVVDTVRAFFSGVDR